MQAACPLAPFTHLDGHDLCPSFGALIDENGNSYYKCFACNYHGRISSLARILGKYRHNNLMHYNAVAIRADDADKAALPLVSWRDEEHEDEYDQAQESIPDEVFEGIYDSACKIPAAVEYCVGRGISTETMESLGLRWDSGQERVLFPVRGLCSELYGFTGRAVNPGAQPKVRDYSGLAKRQHILGAHRWRQQEERPLIIVEGLFDFAHLVELNIEAVADVGALMGCAFTAWKESLITQRGMPAFLLLDDDEAGEASLFGRIKPDGERDIYSGAALRLSKEIKLHIPAYPAGKREPTDLTRRDIWAMLRHTPRWGIQEEQR